MLQNENDKGEDLEGKKKRYGLKNSVVNQHVFKVSL